MKIAKHIVGLSLLMALVAMTSCVFDDGTDSGGKRGEPSDKVNIEIFTRSHSYDLPTKAPGANDSGVETTPFVLVFAGSSGSAVFVEAVRAIELAGINKRYVELTRQPVGNYQILILANNQDYFNYDNVLHEFTAENLNLYLQAATLSQVSEKLLSEKLDSPWHTTLPYTSSDWTRKLPMSYLLQITNAAIDENTTLGEAEGVGSGPLLLVRMVARVTFRTAPTGSFKLTGIMSASNIPVQSRIYNYDGNPPANVTDVTNIAQTDYSGNLMDIVVRSWGAEPRPLVEDGQLFVHESSAVNQTYFIIKGDLTDDFGSGSVETRTYYYKLAAATVNNTVWEYYDLKRNHVYEYNIVSVTGPGYRTAAEAAAAPPANTSRIVYTLTEIDLSSHNVITNGSYYLGVSNSRYIVYTDSPSDSHHAFSVVTDYFSLQGAARVPGYVRSTAGITCDVTEIPVSVNASNPLAVNISFTGSTTTGQVEVGVGSLLLSVNVERRSALPSVMNGAPVTFYQYYKDPSQSVGQWQYEYYAVSAAVENGTTWIKLAPGAETAPVAADAYTSGTGRTFAPDPVRIPDVTDTAASLTGKIQIFVDDNGSGTRSGTVYLSTGMNPSVPAQYKAERIKIDIEQL